MPVIYPTHVDSPMILKDVDNALEKLYNAIIHQTNTDLIPKEAISLHKYIRMWRNLISAWLVFAKDFKRESDPEYIEYQRLKAKFEGKLKEN